MQNYIRFASDWQKFKAGMDRGWTTQTTVNDDNWRNHINHAIKNAKIFRIDQDLKTMLAMTTPPNKNDDVPLPFEDMFLDISFTNEELQNYGIEPKGTKEIVGLAISKGTLNLKKEGDQSDKEIGHCIRMVACIWHGKEVRYETFSRNVSLDDGEYKNTPVKQVMTKIVPKQVTKFLHHFAINFINLLNNPDISTVEIPTDIAQNIKRGLRGRPPIPAQAIIRVTGTLKKYVDRLRADPQWTYNYRFFVRGHFRHLRSEKWGDKQGTRIWIPPYIKGQGMLIEKEYMVR